MKVADLPRLGIIENAVNPGRFGEWSDLRNKDVLCLGFSEEQIDTHIAPHEPNSIHLLTYWADHVDASISKYELSIGDITKRTDYSDGTFDTLLTLSVLEHVSDLEAAFEEMSRVVKRGGEMLHIFGPAWSSAYGHHLCASDEDPNLNFVKWQMPAHFHLLSSAEEICEYYSDAGYDDALGEWVATHISTDPFINRVPYDDYVRIMHQFQIVAFHTMYNALPADHLRQLKSRFADWRDFSTYGGLYKLLNLPT